MMENQRVWAEINLDNIVHNTHALRELIPSQTKLMAVVKADGYGHGAVECAKCALYSGAQYLGVAIVEEGVSLRENNILEPVLILGYAPEIKMIDVVKHNLTQTVYHIEMARSLSNTAQKLNKIARVHIKIDTGMRRLGFQPGQKSLHEILEISRMPGILVEGVYSHFADADDLDSSFGLVQSGLFLDFLSELSAAGLTGFMKHMCNSAGTLRLDSMHMDMVRPGIFLYGHSPSAGMDISGIGLKTIMGVKSRVSYVKSLGAGESIGYSRLYYTDKPTVVATVPVGYADGFSRRLSNKGRVIINGDYAPIIGNICMDQFMVDVTHIPSIKENDEVVLMGNAGSKSVSADELAEITGVISYEILSNIGKRIPRIYIRNGEIIKLSRL